METIAMNGLQFILRKDGTAAVCRCLRPEQSVAIPETVQGHSVTEIGDHAFFGAALKEIRIPASITHIAENVFPSRSVVDEDAMASAREEYSRFSHYGNIPRYCIYEREAYESAEMATHMVFYKDVYDMTAIVEPGSCAEQYCRRKKIPFRT